MPLSFKFPFRDKEHDDKQYFNDMFVKAYEEGGIFINGAGALGVNLAHIAVRKVREYEETKEKPDISGYRIYLGDTISVREIKMRIAESTVQKLREKFGSSLENYSGAHEDKQHFLKLLSLYGDTEEQRMELLKRLTESERGQILPILRVSDLASCLKLFSHQEGGTKNQEAAFDTNYHVLAVPFATQDQYTEALISHIKHEESEYLINRALGRALRGGLTGAYAGLRRKTDHLREDLKKYPNVNNVIRSLRTKVKHILNCSKGGRVTDGRYLGPGETLLRKLDKAGIKSAKVASLSGPNIAQQLTGERSSCATIAGKDDLDTAKIFQDIFNERRFHVYIDEYMRATEGGGLYKNIFSIVAGYVRERFKLSQDEYAHLVSYLLTSIKNCAELVDDKIATADFQDYLEAEKATSLKEKEAKVDNGIPSDPREMVKVIMKRVNKFRKGKKSKKSEPEKNLADFYGVLRQKFDGLSGMGDLVLCCYDGPSRNRRYGEMLAQGKDPEEAHRELGTVEGIDSGKEILKYLGEQAANNGALKAFDRIINNDEPEKVWDELKPFVMADCRIKEVDKKTVDNILKCTYFLKYIIDKLHLQGNSKAALIAKIFVELKKILPSPDYGQLALPKILQILYSDEPLSLEVTNDDIGTIRGKDFYVRADELKDIVLEIYEDSSRKHTNIPTFKTIYDLVSKWERQANLTQAELFEFIDDFFQYTSVREFGRSGLSKKEYRYPELPTIGEVIEIKLRQIAELRRIGIDEIADYNLVTLETFYLNRLNRLAEVEQEKVKKDGNSQYDGDGRTNGTRFVQGFINQRHKPRHAIVLDWIRIFFEEESCVLGLQNLEKVRRIMKQKGKRVVFTMNHTSNIDQLVNSVALTDAGYEDVMDKTMALAGTKIIENPFIKEYALTEALLLLNNAVGSREGDLYSELPRTKSTFERKKHLTEFYAQYFAVAFLHRVNIHAYPQATRERIPIDNPERFQEMDTKLFPCIESNKGFTAAKRVKKGVFENLGPFTPLKKLAALAHMPELLAHLSEKNYRKIVESITKIIQYNLIDERSSFVHFLQMQFQSDKPENIFIVPSRLKNVTKIIPASNLMEYEIPICTERVEVEYMEPITFKALEQKANQLISKKQSLIKRLLGNEYERRIHINIMANAHKTKMIEAGETEEAIAEEMAKFNQKVEATLQMMSGARYDTLQMMGDLVMRYSAHMYPFNMGADQEMYIMDEYNPCAELERQFWLDQKTIEENRQPGNKAPIKTHTPERKREKIEAARKTILNSFSDVEYNGWVTKAVG